jgi:hypothetical protein
MHLNFQAKSLAARGSEGTKCNLKARQLILSAVVCDSLFVMISLAAMLAEVVVTGCAAS